MFRASGVLGHILLFIRFEVLGRGSGLFRD